MGLRERNAAQTRALILDVAMELFVAQGFEATKMEEVAHRADIGVSTLYRYFPTKDRLLTEPLALRGQMAAALRERPADESLDVALGHALRAILSTTRPDTVRLRQLFAVLASAPGAQASLRDEAVQERVLLEQAIADRLGRSQDDVFCQMTARLAMSVLELIGLRDGIGIPDDNASAVRKAIEYLHGLLEQLHAEPPVLPRLNADA